MVENEEIYSKINIKDIKSKYIIKEAFSFLDEKKKLNMILYNKELKKELKVNIEYYKYISGKYKIGKKNGEGKEYNFDDELIFEGEYLNGKRNGKGKEFNEYGEIKFEGEYLNGKRNGHGKEYNYDGYLIFEGEYLNGKKMQMEKEKNMIIMAN